MLEPLFTKEYKLFDYNFKSESKYHAKDITLWPWHGLNSDPKSIALYSKSYESH